MPTPGNTKRSGTANSKRQQEQHTSTVSESQPRPGQAESRCFRLPEGASIFFFLTIFYLFIRLCWISAVAGGIFDLHCCMLALSFFFNCDMWDPVP